MLYMLLTPDRARSCTSQQLRRGRLAPAAPPVSRLHHTRPRPFGSCVMTMQSPQALDCTFPRYSSAAASTRRRIQ